MKANKGSAGVDNQTIEDFEQGLEKNRRRFAELIRRFMNCEINRHEFFEDEARREATGCEDASKAIDRFCGVLIARRRRTYWRPIVLLQPNSNNYTNGVSFFCSLDLEYKWPDDLGGLQQVDHLGDVIKILTLGLSTVIDQFLSTRAKVFWENYKKAGDFDVWPFTSRSDYENERL